MIEKLTVEEVNGELNVYIWESQDKYQTLFNEGHNLDYSALLGAAFLFANFKHLSITVLESAVEYIAARVNIEM